MSNTILKITRRTVEELEGLQMGVIENSVRFYNTIANMYNKSNNAHLATPVTQVERRNMNELYGLLLSSIDFSHKEKELNLINIKRIKPHKIYKIKLKIIKKYSNTKKI